MNGLSRAPSLSDALNYSVNKPGAAEVIGQSLYDLQIYATAGATQLNFFQNPVGQGLSASPGNANNPKTFADTNMNLAGSLPSPQMFLVTNIQITFEPGSVATANTFTPQRPYSFVAVPTAAVPASAGAANDVSAIIESGELEFIVGSKTFLREAKLNRFPPKARTEVLSSLATNSATTGSLATVWAQAFGEPYPIDPPILIPSNQNFVIRLNFPVAIATPSGFNGRLGVFLDGYQYRAVQ
jgi:hypothetical protein